METKVIKTRFAPSPTGTLHIGGVRTALYEFLVAKKNKGIFSLRIEDTDRNRYVEGSVEDIIETLKWLDLQPDGEVIYQSKRTELYKKYAEELVEKNLAYKQDGAIWFKTIKEGKTVMTDLIGQKEIEFDNSTQADFVILKSDGFPTYHLAHVVDDHLMETNPVIRGAEWISSIPKHIMLFNAFGWQIPKYAHLPIILGPDKSKLSKRHGAKAASDFRKEGYLPEAIINYMALLGWTPQTEEILNLEEMVKEFDLSKVHVSNPIFDITKLDWMNGEYIRMMSDEQLTKRLQEFLVDHPAKDQIGKVAPLIKERIKKLSDFVPLTDFFWQQPEYDKSVFEKLKIKDFKLALTKVVEKLEVLGQPWKSEKFEATFRTLAEELDSPVKDTFQLIRVAVSGQLVTPPLFESLEILGEDETLKRVKSVLENFDQIPNLSEKI